MHQDVLLIEFILSLNSFAFINADSMIKTFYLSRSTFVGLRDFSENLDYLIANERISDKFSLLDY